MNSVNHDDRIATLEARLAHPKSLLAGGLLYQRLLVEGPKPQQP